MSGLFGIRLNPNVEPETTHGAMVIFNQIELCSEPPQSLLISCLVPIPPTSETKSPFPQTVIALTQSFGYPWARIVLLMENKRNKRNKRNNKG